MTTSPVGMLMIGVGLDIPDAKLRGEAVARHAGAARRLRAQPDELQHHLGAQLETARRRRDRRSPAGVTDRALGRKGAKLLLAQVAMRVTK